MEPIIIKHEDIKKVIQSDNSYIQVGKRKFLLIEVEEVNNDNYYEVVDAEEERHMLEALNGKNPNLSEDDIYALEISIGGK